MQKSGGALGGKHGPEGAAAPHLDGCGTLHICIIHVMLPTQASS